MDVLDKLKQSLLEQEAVMQNKHSYLMECTLRNRGYDEAFLSSIETQSVNGLRDMDRMCEELYAIRCSGGLIVQYSDFDFDGFASGIIGFSGLAELGFRVSLFLPDVTAGYGFDAGTVRDIVGKYPDVAAILTSDVGIACHKGIAEAKRLGLKVFVTDHHKLSDGKGLPDADTIVDPMRPDEVYEHSGICGAYVLYQCLERYASLYGNRYLLEQIRRLRVFAGIATVSDSMPMLYENRDLVRDAVSICRLVYADGSDFAVCHIQGHDIYRRAFYGLHLVLKLLAEKGKISSFRDIDEDLFGYYIAPMFNSVKRMDGSSERAYGVFFGQSPKEDADYLYELNLKRKASVVEYLAEAMGREQPYAPYIWFCSAGKGILGLIAQRIRDRVHVPCLAVNPDLGYSGSGRSVSGYPFLSNVMALGFSGGGHEPAFGCSLGTLDGVRRLHEFLSVDVPRFLSQVEVPEGVQQYPDFIIAEDGSGDTRIDILGFLEYLRELERYRPFGPAFPAPDVVLKFDMADADVKFIGKRPEPGPDGEERQRPHLKVTLEHGLEVLLWNQSQYLPIMQSQGTCYVRGQLGLSVYMDKRTVTFTGLYQVPDGLGVEQPVREA